MAQVYQDPSGNYVAIKEDGTQVPVLPSQMKGASVSDFSPVHQEQGVSWGQRFAVKNLASNPASARAYLDSVGYEVRPYGSGFNFAVRPKNSGPRVPWKVVDPDGFDPQDILDLTSDAVTLGAQTLAGTVAAPAMAGGPPGMAVEAGAVGAAGAGVEALKQAAGAAAGIPGNVDVGNVAAAGAGGALSVPVARGVAGAARGVGSALGSMARSVGARFAGIESSAALSGADALKDAAEWSVANPGKLMKSPEEAGGILRAAIRRVANTPFPEKDEALGMAKNAAMDGHTINIRPTMDAIQSEMMMPTDYKSWMEPGSPWDEAGNLLAEPIPELGKKTPIARTPELQVKHAVDPNLQANLDKTMATIQALLRDDPAHAVPMDRAVLIKNYLQQIARQKGAFTQTPPGQAFRNIITKQAELLRGQIEEAMGNAGQPNYVPVMRAFEKKTAMMHDWTKALRVKDGSTAADISRTNFVRSLYGNSKAAWLTALDDVETTFGVSGLKAAVREATIGARTGLSTEAGPSLLGSNTRSALGLGAIAFGHPLIGAAEMAATSPKVIMGATKAGMRMAPLASAATGAAARAGSVAAAREGAMAVGKGIARNDAKKPTRIGI